MGRPTLAQPVEHHPPDRPRIGLVPWAVATGGPATSQRRPRMNALQHVPRALVGSRLRLLMSATFAVALAATGIALAGPASAATQVCSNQTGGSGGTYFQMWSAGQGSACINLNSTS